MAETKVKWYESEAGQTSMMRIMGMLGTVLGILVGLTGIAVAIVSLVKGNLAETGAVALGFVTAGGGLITGLGFAKAKQAQAENGGAQ